MSFKTNDKYYPLAVNEDGVVLNLETKNIRKLYKNNSGYYTVSTRKKSYLVHRLVAEIWIPNPHNKEQVNHKDCNKLNNSVSNLEWVTRSENAIHAFENGLLVFNGVCGEDSNLSRFTDEEIHNICRDICCGIRNIDIARKYNISSGYVKALKNKEQRKNITELYDFPRKSRRSISVQTAHWVCKMIAEGLTNKQILSLSRSTGLNKDILRGIRGKISYQDISSLYF